VYHRLRRYAPYGEIGLKKSTKFLEENNFDFTQMGKELALNEIEYQNHSGEIKYYLDNFLSLSEHGLYCKCNGAITDNLIIGYPGFVTIDKKIIQLELLLNRIKSEYSLSRRLYFDFLTFESGDNVHYEELLDGIINGIRHEKLRTSFRLCFGILDKIAEGVCSLFELEIKDGESIYFESFWNNQKAPKDRWSKINSIKNIHLTALYSIACDLNKRNGEFGFYKIWRNRLEHGVFSLTKSDDSDYKMLTEKLFSEHTTTTNFENKTKHILQLTRSAIFSFVFCVRQELIN